MKFAIALVVATLITFVAAQQNGHWRFKLRATTLRGATPSLGGYVDINSAGVAGFGRTGNPTYSGFINYMTSTSNELPRGLLHKEDGNLPGYLLPSSTPGLYDFHYGPIPSGVPGVLSQDFAIITLSCGGQCGGLQLVYAPASSVRRWIAYPDGAGYKIRYYNGQGPPPTGGYDLWLWREFV